MESGELGILESGTLTQADAVWEEARRRAAIIGPLAAKEKTPVSLAAEAGERLGLSARTIYTLLRRYKASGGSLLSLAPTQSLGGRGGSRLPEETERIITSSLTELYLSRQRVKIESVVKEIRHRCRRAGVKPPSSNTIRTRIRRLRPEEVVRKREGREAARRLESAGGQFPPVSRPLEVVQIDHTPVDLIVVDPLSRHPIGRAFLTLGIDVYSRCITGFCLTLEPPSAVSVGLCLAHGAMEKQTWLTRLGVTASWPIQGKPFVLHVDNGAEFHSEALRRGCEVHGITLRYRPPREPHFGGTIERVLGTLMQMIHELPGTTFSNPSERGAYNSEREAVFTLTELEQWFALAITGPYHESLHTGIGEAPLARWKKGIGESGEPQSLSHFKAFLVDFLPVLKRGIHRQGFVIDHIWYFSNALRPWIAERDQGHVFLIRRDPRDISRIWVLHPKERHYLEIPYRTMSYPAVTLWEHQQALARLRAESRAAINEQAIFAAIQRMRQVAQQAASQTKAARRANTRRAHLEPALPPAVAPPTGDEEILSASLAVSPFAEIEEW